MMSRGELSADAARVLACLPREPATAVISEIAQDVFQLSDDDSYREQRSACGRVRRALQEIRRHFRVYRDYRSYDVRGRRIPWGQRERYGIAREYWHCAQELAECDAAG